MYIINLSEFLETLKQNTYTVNTDKLYLFITNIFQVFKLYLGRKKSLKQGIEIGQITQQKYL